MSTREILKKIKKIEIKSRKLVDEFFGGQYHSVFKGQGIEFQEVREYVPGDEVRNIDWNVTARVGIPFIKKFQEERELTVMIAMDLSASQLFGSDLVLKREIGGELAAAIAFSAMKNNDRVGLALFSDQTELFIPPGKGSRHILRIIRESVYFKPRSTLTRLATACNLLNSVMKRKGIILFISDFLDKNFDREMRTLMARQDVIPIILRDKREVELPARGFYRLRNPETNGAGEIMMIDVNDPKLRALYRTNVTRHYQEITSLFRQSGCTPVEIFTDSDWVKVLRRYFEKRSRRRR